MIIFVSAPTKGVVVDGELTPQFLKRIAQLHMDYPEHTFIVPMIHGYALLKYMETDPTWEHWGKYCKNLIDVSDESWVLMYDGWKTSTGVTDEIALSVTFEKPVRFIPILVDGE